MLWIGTFLAAYLAIPLIRVLFVTLPKKSNDETILAWLKAHPHHFWLNYLWRHGNSMNNDGAAAIACVSWFGVTAFSLVMLLGFLLGFKESHSFQPQLISAVVTGFSTYMSFELWAYIRRTYNAEAWLESNLNQLENTISPAEIREAKKISKKLLKMLKHKKHREQFKAVATRLQKLVKEEIPRLLQNEKLLVDLVADAEKTVQLEKENGILEGEKQLMADSERDLETLKKRLEDTNNKIKLILCFLNHFSVRLSVLVSADTSEEVERSLFEVQQDLDQMLKADE